MPLWVNEIMYIKCLTESYSIKGSKKINKQT